MPDKEGAMRNVPKPVPGTLYTRWGGGPAIDFCRKLGLDSAPAVQHEIDRALRRGSPVSITGGIIQVDGAAVPDTAFDHAIVPGQRYPLWFVPLPSRSNP